MNLRLHKPLCIFDLETTGLSISSDRIVEICIVKVLPNGDKTVKTWRVNPEKHIPKEVSEIHGITDEDVKDAPTFKQIAPQVWSLIEDSDLGGFNSDRFDIPLLAEELLRAGYDFDLNRHRTIDVKNIYFKKEPRNLTAAYHFYCDKNLEDAHSAEADTLATFEVLDAQVGKYDDIGTTTAELSDFSTHSRSADLAGFIGFNAKGEEIFNFGKHKGKRVTDVLQTDSGYFGWIQNADFPLYTKKVLTAIKLKSKF